MFRKLDVGEVVLEGGARCVFSSGGIRVVVVVLVSKVELRVALETPVRSFYVNSSHSRTSISIPPRCSSRYRFFSSSLLVSGKETVCPPW